MLIPIAPMPNAIRITPEAIPPYSSHFRFSTVLYLPNVGLRHAASLALLTARRRS